MKFSRSSRFPVKLVGGLILSFFSFCLMVPLRIVGLFVKFDRSIVFLLGFVQEREVGSRYSSFVFGISEVLFLVLFLASVLFC